MPEIKCKDFTNADCDFVAKGETAEETKAAFYKHGEDTPIHAEKMKDVTPEEKEAFGKKVDEHLASQ